MYRQLATKEDDVVNKSFYLPTNDELIAAKSSIQNLVGASIMGAVPLSFFGSVLVNQIYSHDSPWAVVPTSVVFVWTFTCLIRLLHSLHIISKANRYGVMKGHREC